MNQEEVKINTIEIESIDWPTEQRPDTSRVIENLKRAYLEIDKSSPYSKVCKIVNETLKLDDNRIVVPEKQRHQLIIPHHECFGQEQTDKLYERIKVSYYWPNMYNEIRKLVKSWDTCQQKKSLPLDVVELGHIADLNKF